MTNNWAMLHQMSESLKLQYGQGEFEVVGGLLWIFGFGYTCTVEIHEGRYLCTRHEAGHDKGVLMILEASQEDNYDAAMLRLTAWLQEGLHREMSRAEDYY